MRYTHPQVMILDPSITTIASTNKEGLCREASAPTQKSSSAYEVDE